MSNGMNELMELDFTSNEAPVVIREDGEVKRFTLREPSFNVYSQFVEQRQASLIYMGRGDAEKGSALAKELPAFLVGNMLHNEEGKLVGPKVVAGWRTTLVEQLFLRATHLAGVQTKDDKFANQLEEALKSADSPVTWEALRDFVKQLPPEKFDKVWVYFGVEPDQGKK